MSYILDALRRAEAERERGTVPTVHAHPVPADAAAGKAGTRRALPWLWAGGAILLLMLGAAIAQWLSRARPAPAVILAAPQQQLPQQAPQQAPQPPPAPPPVVAQPDPVAVVREPTRPLAQAVARKAPVPAPARAEPPPVDRPVPLASALPEDLRRQLPALTAGGAMYSEAPANRMLIINGQLFHEGDRVAPDLVLEQIKLRGAVLSFKGQRFRISY